MASPFSGKKKAKSSLPPSLEINTQVYRFFAAHELLNKHPAQWIHGKVTGSSQEAGKGSRKPKKWWTVSFDAPATRPLTCDTDELGDWKAQADDFRGKKDIIAKQVGKELIVRWTEEDSRRSMTAWHNEFRTCVVTKFIACQQEFVLQYKCGYAKTVECEDFIHMLDESTELAACSKKRVYNKILDARAEKCTQKTAAIPEEIPAGPAYTVIPNVEPHTNHDARKSEEAAKIQRQRDAMFRMQQDEGVAARNLQDVDALVGGTTVDSEVLSKETQDELKRLANVVALKTRAVENATEALQKQAEVKASNAIAHDLQVAETARVQAAALHEANENALQAVAALQKAKADALEKANAYAHQKANADRLLVAETARLQGAAALQKANEDAVQKANDEALQKANDEALEAAAAQQKANEEAVLKATEEALQKANAVALQKANDEALQAAAALQKATEDALHKANADALQKANAVALQKVQKANDEALQKANDEALQAAAAQQKANEEAVLKATEEALQKANEKANEEVNAVAQQEANEDALKKANELQVGGATAPVEGGVEPGINEFMELLNGVDEHEERHDGKRYPPPPKASPPGTVTTKDKKVPIKRKRAKARILASVKARTETHQGPESELQGSDDDGELEVEDYFVSQSANTARRILWQRGHAATVPSVVDEMIRDATVSTLTAALATMREYGFAIIHDMTEVFAPGNRCTAQQRDFLARRT